MLARLLILSTVLTLVCIGLALRPLRPLLAAGRTGRRRVSGGQGAPLPRQLVFRRFG